MSNADGGLILTAEINNREKENLNCVIVAGSGFTGGKAGQREATTAGDIAAFAPETYGHRCIRRQWFRQFSRRRFHQRTSSSLLISDRR